jgi:hypothetical protein
MKPASSKQIEFTIRQLKVRQATKDEDFKGADVFLNQLAVGHRRRYIVLGKWGDISIRKRDFTYSEYEKIMDGSCLAQLFIFEFDNAYVICTTKDIKACLEDTWKHGYVHNKQEPNGFYTIKLSQIPHLLIDKPSPSS